MNEPAAFSAAWDAAEAAYMERLREALAGHEGWRDRFRAGAELTLRAAEECPGEARFLVVEASAAPLGRERQRALRDRLVELIDSARLELDDPDLPPPATASWIAAIFLDRIYRRLHSADGPDLPSQLPALLFLGISAYFGPEAGLRELL